MAPKKYLVLNIVLLLSLLAVGSRALSIDTFNSIKNRWLNMIIDDRHAVLVSTRDRDIELYSMDAGLTTLTR